MTYHSCGCITTLLNPDMPSWDIPEIEIEYCLNHAAGFALMKTSESPDIGKTVRILCGVSEGKIGKIIAVDQGHQEGTRERIVDGELYRVAIIRPYQVELENGHYPIRNWWQWNELEQVKG